MKSHDYGEGTDLPFPVRLPSDMSLLYPFIEFESIENNFAVAYNISQIYRTEDLFLGKRISGSIGFDPSADSRLILAGGYTDTLISDPKILLQLNTDWYGRWNKSNSSWEDAVLNLNLDYHRGQTDKRGPFTLGFLPVSLTICSMALRLRWVAAPDCEGLTVTS